MLHELDSLVSVFKRSKVTEAAQVTQLSSIRTIGAFWPCMGVALRHAIPYGTYGQSLPGENALRPRFERHAPAIRNWLFLQLELSR